MHLKLHNLNDEFHISKSSSLPLYSIHTLSLSPPLCVAAAAACLPLCLFLEAHNMADMCFVIVSTSSSLLAYKGLLIAPPPSTSHPKQQITLKIILAWNQGCYNYRTEQLIV